MHKLTKLTPIAFAVGCVLGLAPIVSVLAADGVSSKMETGEKNAEQSLSAVLVTAIRKPLYDVRDINLGAFGAKDTFDVPVSIQSYSSELIENQRARTLNDVLKNDPSVQNTAVGGAFDNISIRGFAIDWANTMRRDGLSLAPYQDVPLENIERIDVLKGPSGFLYGYNSPGGTVNYVLKRPTAKSFAAVTGELRNHNGRYTHLDAGGKFGEDSSIGYRINVAGEKVGDFTHANDLSRSFMSGALDWKLSRDALLRFDFDVQNKDLAAQPMIGPQTNGQLPPQIDGRVLLGQPWLQYKTRTHNLGARLDYALNDKWSLTAQFNHSYNKRLAAFPGIYKVRADGTIVSGDIYLSPDQEFRANSGQTFVSGHFNMGGIGHELVAGLSMRNYQARDSGFIELPITVGNIFKPVYSVQPALPTAPAKNVTDNQQSSLFVSDLLTFNESWQAIMGLRHIRYTNDFTRPNQPTVTYQQNSTVPSAGLIYKPSKRVMTYASYSQGLEQGGVAPYNSANAGEWMKPIKSRQVELGAKADVNDGLTLGAAVFEIEKGLEYTNSSKVYVQDGRQRHRGLEFTAGGQLTKDLSVVAGLALLDSEQVNTGDPSVRGKRTANVPKTQSSLFLDYRVPNVTGLNVNGGIYHVGARPLDSVNSVDLPAYARLDLGARYVTKVGGQKTTWRVNIENVTDKRYWSAANYSSVYPGKPRSIGLSAEVEF
jgi:iron complex outermembrane receptor protein